MSGGHFLCLYKHGILPVFHLASFGQHSYLETDLCDCQQLVCLPCQVVVYYAVLMFSSADGCVSRSRFLAVVNDTAVNVDVRVMVIASFFLGKQCLYHKHLGVEWWDRMGSGG